MNQPSFGWGVWIVLYFFLGGVAAGAYFTAALAEIFGDQRDRSMAKVGYTTKRSAFPMKAVQLRRRSGAGLSCGSLRLSHLSAEIASRPHSQWTPSTQSD